jgi:hypothetical protein
MGAIRGHQASLKLFKNGQPAGIVNVTSFDINQDSDFSRAFYVGNKMGEGDQSVLGWSGSIDCEVKDNAVDEMIDSIIAGNQAGIGVDEITLVTEEQYPNGTSASYVYYDMQLKMSKKTGGMNEKVTKRLDFQASGRQIL